MGTSNDTLAEPTGRRERKKQATRQALHEAAWALVEERGLANVTVEAITDRVDVAARTFFNYYSSKEEAVLGSGHERVELACALMAERLAAGDSPLDAVRVVMHSEYTWRDQTSEQFHRRVQLLRHEPLLFSVAATQWEDMGRRLAKVVAAATGADMDSDVYPQLVVNVGVAAARTAMMHWADHPSQDLPVLIDDAIAVVKAGLPSPATSPLTSEPSLGTR